MDSQDLNAIVSCDIDLQNLIRSWPGLIGNNICQEKQINKWTNERKYTAFTNNVR